MSYDGYFANLYNIGTVGGSGNDLFWAGSPRWDAADTSCPSYVNLGSGWVDNGTVTCRLGQAAPDPDPGSIANPLPADFCYLIVSEPIWAAVSGVDETHPCYGVGENVTGQLSGGCGPQAPLDLPDGHIYIDGTLCELVALDGTPEGDWLTGGSRYVVNPSPVTYTGMDPSDPANSILWPAATIAAASVLISTEKETGAVRVGWLEGQYVLSVHRMRYLEPPAQGWMCIL